jgi:hypothetical protein
MEVRGNIFRFPARPRNLSLLQSVQRGSKVHQLYTAEASGVSYPGEETPGSKADLSPPLIATIKNNMCHTTTYRFKSGSGPLCFMP